MGVIPGGRQEGKSLHERFGTRSNGLLRNERLGHTRLRVTQCTQRPRWLSPVAASKATCVSVSRLLPSLLLQKRLQPRTCSGEEEDTPDSFHVRLLGIPLFQRWNIFEICLQFLGSWQSTRGWLPVLFFFFP